ncbi:uncharacterized protein LOC131930113 [Physella acuta]|uniref:uncharacterized protein LOC131930113 n=1 Tax=Physella acuta TaxID=109671 RepID=UPI0027DB502B|nr:uncharacterized protein LOC131930113 [Physella acuta]
MITKIQDIELPHKAACHLIADEGHILAKTYRPHTGKNIYLSGLHKDGTIRKRKKILETSVLLNTGKVFSLGFTTVAIETGQAIANDVSAKIEEVAYLNGNKEDELVDILLKMSYFMNDRAANEKSQMNVLKPGGVMF